MAVVTREGNGAKTGRSGSLFSRLYADGRVKDSHWTSVLEWVGDECSQGEGLPLPTGWTRRLPERTGQGRHEDDSGSPLLAVSSSSVTP